jgi:hypothetical protein
MKTLLGVCGPKGWVVSPGNLAVRQAGIGGGPGRLENVMNLSTYVG